MPEVLDRTAIETVFLHVGPGDQDVGAFLRKPAGKARPLTREGRRTDAGPRPDRGRSPGGDDGRPPAQLCACTGWPSSRRSCSPRPGRASSIDRMIGDHPGRSGDGRANPLGRRTSATIRPATSPHRRLSSDRQWNRDLARSSGGRPASATAVLPSSVLRPGTVAELCVRGFATTSSQGPRHLSPRWRDGPRLRRRARAGPASPSIPAASAGSSTIPTPT